MDSFLFFASNFFFSSALFKLCAFSYSAAHGATNIVPVKKAPCIVPALTSIHRRATATEKMVPSTLKNRLGSSVAIVVVDTVKTPSGNVKPHQP